MSAHKLTVIGIILMVGSIALALLLPEIFYFALKAKYEDDITSTSARIESLTCNTSYTRLGARPKRRRNVTYHYKITVFLDDEVVELIDHDSPSKEVILENSDDIKVYCLDGKYAYDKKDFYAVPDELTYVFMFTGAMGLLCVIVGNRIDKSKYSY